MLFSFNNMLEYIELGVDISRVQLLWAAASAKVFLQSLSGICEQNGSKNGLVTAVSGPVHTLNIYLI